MKDQGILLINLGTPKEATVKSVKRYLKEFLMDRRIIDIPWVFRWCLVNLIIVPFRAKNSTKAYQSIWTKDGSPLKVYMQQLVQAIENKLAPNYQIKLAMRYGEPSIDTALDAFDSHIKSLVVIPVFPQYASAVNGSAIDKLFENREKN